MHSIFLSYCWQNSNFADAIDHAFLPTGIKLKRDIRDINYTDSIKEYMLEIRSVDFVLILISDDFLKSANCMFEVLEVLKEQNFKEKILPVLISGTNIFRAEDKLGYIRYWGDRYTELKEKLQGLDPTSTIELLRELRHYQNIGQSLDAFFAQITDMNLITDKELTDSNFKTIFDHLGISDDGFIKRILAVSRINNPEERDIGLDLLEKEYPNSAQIAFVKGSIAFDSKETKKSSHFYRQAISLDPAFAASYYNLGFNLEIEEDFVAAIEMYEKAIALEPQNARAFNNLGRIYSQETKEYKKARKFYEQAFEINPYDADTNYNLAVLIQNHFNDFGLAESFYQTAIEVKPDFHSYLSYGNLLWKKLNKINQAAKMFKLALELDKNNKEVLLRLGKLYEFDYGHYLTAKLYYEKAVQINPTAEDHHDYCTFLLHRVFKNGFKKDAKWHYDTACSLDPKVKDLELEKYFSLS